MAILVTKRGRDEARASSSLRWLRMLLGAAALALVLTVVATRCDLAIGLQHGHDQSPIVRQLPDAVRVVTAADRPETSDEPVMNAHRQPTADASNDGTLESPLPTPRTLVLPAAMTTKVTCDDDSLAAGRTIGARELGHSLDDRAGVPDARWTEPPEALATKDECTRLTKTTIQRFALDDFEIGGGMCFSAQGMNPIIHDGGRDVMGDTAMGALETGKHLNKKLADFWPWLRAATTVPTYDSDIWPRRCAQLPAVLVPVAYKADNHMHVLHRVVSVARVLRSEYGPNWRKNVVVVYLVLESSQIASIKFNFTNAHATFARYLSRQWLVLPVGQWDMFGVSKISEDVCFDRVRVVRWYKGTKKSMEPTRALFTWNGDRTDADFDDAARFRYEFAESHGCKIATTAPSRELQMQNTPAQRRLLKVLIVYRSSSRAFLHWDRLWPALQQLAAKRSMSLVIAEHIKMTPQELIQSHADADVMIGTIGGGLLWSLLMGQGRVLVELSAGYGCSAGKHGWNTSTRCDYGGNAHAARQQHLVVHVPKYSLGEPMCVRIGLKKQKCDEPNLFVPLRVWDAMLSAAACKVFQPDEPCPLADPVGFNATWDIPPPTMNGSRVGTLPTVE